MNNFQTEYVSFIGTSFIDPIAALIEKLMKLNPKGPNEVQASVIENGYSASIVVLTVILLESILNRTKYIMDMHNKCSALNFFKSISNDIQLNQQLEEIYVLRDSIAHSHVWSATIEWNDRGLSFVDLPERQVSYGDKKYEKLLMRMYANLKFLS